MKTVTIQIGNSDDKLPQREWAEFVSAVVIVLMDADVAIHFGGHSNPADPWQNAAWVIVGEPKAIALLKKQLVHARSRYRQDSIAWTEADKTEFV